MSAEAREFRHRLTDPVRLCKALGLFDGAKRQGGGLLVLCPAHNERTPSCSVTVGPDGTIRAKCFGCDWSADVLGLIAQVNGLSLRTQFAEVMAAAGELAGDAPVAHRNVSASPRPLPQPERTYPPANEVTALWGSARRVDRCADAWEALRARGIDPDLVADLDLARALPTDAAVPRWARCKLGSWPDAGYRLLVPLYDARGELRSLRAWAVEDVRDGEFAADASFEEVRAIQASREKLDKRLPPSGHRLSGLVMANQPALEMLRGKKKAARVVIGEGEPDYLSLAATDSGVAILGIMSGSWTSEMAAAVTGGAEVCVITHADEAGDRYANDIIKTLEHRCSTWRKR